MYIYTSFQTPAGIDEQTTRSSAMTTTLQQQTTTGTWTIDAAHTSVEFSAKHMMITTVKGRIADARGTIAIDAAAPERSAVQVELDAASIDTRNEQRDGHLRSPDFLDVQSHPVVTFRSREVRGARLEDGARFTVVGDITIRGVTREVALDATYEGSGRDPWGGERVSFSAETKIDRRDFGLTWNAALETGGVLVSNDVRIRLDVQAVRT
jgi:polyisoprenoid-binding protein YceI